MNKSSFTQAVKYSWFIILLFFGNHLSGQSDEYASLLLLANQKSKVKNKNTDDLNEELDIRKQIISLLEDSLEQIKSDTLKTNNSRYETRLEVLREELRNANFNYQKKQLSEDADEAYVKLIHLNTIYREASGQLDEVPDKDSESSSIIKVESLIEQEKDKIRKLEKQLRAPSIAAKEEADNTQESSAEKSEEPKEAAREELFNTSSIVRQLISSSLESGRSFSPDIEMDNKLFEDRKAFMPYPLESSSIHSRYNAGKAGMEFSSGNPSVRAISQGEVIYAKKLGSGYYTIVIMHDNAYYSVYSNIKSSRVYFGDKVQFGQSIGSAALMADKNYLLQFGIWKKTDHINPIHWLKNN